MKDAAVLAPFQYTLDGEIYKSLLMSCDKPAGMIRKRQAHDQRLASSSRLELNCC
jgi:hypothetical protein